MYGGCTLPCRAGLTWTDRTKRVKDAKTEAQKEIEEYRKAKEEEFKKFETEVGRGIHCDTAQAHTHDNCSNQAETKRPRTTPTRKPKLRSRRSRRPARNMAIRWWKT